MEYVVYEKRPGEAACQIAQESAHGAVEAAERHVEKLPHGSLIVVLRHFEHPADCSVWVFGVEYSKPTLVCEADLRHDASHDA